MEWPTTVNGIPIPYDSPLAELEAQVAAASPACWAALWALAANPSDRALDVLLTVLRADDPHLRRAALEAVAKHHRAYTCRSLLRDLLGDPSPPVVRTACEAVAVLGLPEAHDQVLSLIRDPDPSTRQVAIRSLRELWQPSDFREIFRLFEQDPEAAVRKEAGWCLRSNASRDHWAQLFALWAQDPLPRHRIWACELALEFGDRTLQATLDALAVDSDGHVREAARRALAQIDSLF